jgi:hypothetical protein
VEPPSPSGSEPESGDSSSGSDSDEDGRDELGSDSEPLTPVVADVSELRLLGHIHSTETHKARTKANKSREKVAALKQEEVQ